MILAIDRFIDFEAPQMSSHGDHINRVDLTGDGVLLGEKRANTRTRDGKRDISIAGIEASMVSVLILIRGEIDARQVAFLFFLFSQGCSSKYTLESTEYHGYEGEVNQHTRLIQASRERVFQILTDEQAFRQICPEGTIVTFETPPPYGVGTLLKTKITHIYELEWNTQVEEVLPPSKIRLHFLDGFFAGGTEIWEIKSLGEDTQVTHTIIIQPAGILKDLVWALKVRTKHNKMVEAVLDNLKKFSELHPTG